ncbi:SUKH-4 family immunity protein [Streptomyces sp. CA-251247]|uniref:SUKH-4 family immunity protein n=1 Tax=Streptomyces sp. CA-251247 TaxID=3240062 RepID=UPI003D91E899
MWSRNSVSPLSHFPQVAFGRLHGSTATFLASVGLPESKLFGHRMDLEDDSARRLQFGSSLKASLERAGSELPPEAETWEKLGDFVYATVALNPRDGQIYAFPEGESDYQAMHKDISSFVNALIVVNRGRTEYLKLGPDDEQRAHIVDRMTQEIATVDTTPFVDDEGEWETLFDRIRLNMWR